MSEFLVAYLDAIDERLSTGDGSWIRRSLGDGEHRSLVAHRHCALSHVSGNERPAAFRVPTLAK